jgi:anion-transporting  ArsA/GET3 family ATPase
MPVGGGDIVAREMAESLASLVMSRRVLVTAGAGGVGKTTTAAALGVAAAMRGKRVLCLTIDPAKRLAQSLGLQEMTTEARVVAPELFKAAGVEMTGSLTAMMLDTKRTFDELVVRHSSSPQRAQALLQSRLYQYVAGSLAGTQEYMAMEKLAAVKMDPAYDLIVLDTPPTANALDFLDAPRRLTGALDSAAMRWFVEAFEASGKFSLNLMAKGASVVLRGIGKITGGSFLQSLSEFIAQLNDLFGGFRKRAEFVEGMLRGDDLSFVLVTSPSLAALREMEFFSQRLTESRMREGAFVVNRVRTAGTTELPSDARMSEGLRSKVLRASKEQAVLAESDKRAVATLKPSPSTAVVLVSEMEEIHDIPRLVALAEVLMAGGNVR